MQINSVINSRISHNKQNFNSNSANLDMKNNEIYASLQNDNHQNSKLTFMEKLRYSPALFILPAILPVAYGIYYSVKKHLLKKKVKQSPQVLEKLNKFKQSSVRNKLIFCALAVPMYFLTEYINKKNEVKNFLKAQTQVNNFNAENGTNVSLTRVPKSSSELKHKSASFNYISGQIKLSEFITGDIINSKIIQSDVVNHELAHAKQYILMACSNNGINKINYIAINKMAKDLDKNKITLFHNAYEDIKRNNFIDDGTKIRIGGHEINYNDFVIAIYKIIHEKDKNPDNYPIIINKAFYNQAISVRGPLTEQEENQAKAYFEAAEKYPLTLGVSQFINPKSDYNNNLLEKEAFAMNI